MSLGDSHSPPRGEDPVEVELKLAVPEAACAELERRLRVLGRARSVQVETIYYDTPERALRQGRAALRLRRIGGRWFQTLKTGHADSALSRRGEWEAPVSGARLDPGRLSGTPLEALLGAGHGRLQPVFRTRFDRRVQVVQSAQGRVEIAFDRGTIRAGRRLETLCELELEAIEGGPGPLFTLALGLAGRGRNGLALRPAVESKAARGYRLADGGAPRAAGAGAAGFAAGLQAGLTAGEAARRIVEQGVNIVLANAAGASAAADPEFVHQCRVALRRTRSALRVLKLCADPSDPVARELRWMSGQFGAARDWDLFVLQWLPQAQQAVVLPPGVRWEAIADRARARRLAAYARLAGVLASPRFARSALALLQWTQTPAPPGPRLDRLAGQALERGRRRLLAQSRGLERMTANRRHRLRILAKRQRYAIELLAPFAGTPEPARALKLLARLQQALGEANDAQVFQDMLPAVTSSRRAAAQVERWSRHTLRQALPRASGLAQRLRRIGD